METKLDRKGAPYDFSESAGQTALLGPIVALLYPVGIIPDYAARKFAEDARRMARRLTWVLQVCDKAADSVKMQAPLRLQMPEI